MATSRQFRKKQASRPSPTGIQDDHAAPIGEIPPIDGSKQVDKDSKEVIDLLNPTPAVVVDFKQLKRSLAFGFAGGDTAGDLKAALHRAPVAPSNWEPECFEGGLFIAKLLKICMGISIGEFQPKIDTVYLTRLITHPPKDHSVVDFRRAILDELSADKALRSQFEKTYLGLYKMRELFESENRIYEIDTKGRRLETLGAIRDSIEIMRDAFSSCKSGLKRIFRFAQHVASSNAYQRLVELLDFDNHLASVNLTLRIGADGHVRHFEIGQTSENSENRFHQSQFGRFLTRMGMFFRGYLFSEGELTNRWVDSVFEGIERQLPMMIQLLGEMEFYLSALAFKDFAEAKGLSVCLPTMKMPEKNGPSAGQVIENLFNPLLFEQEILPVVCTHNSDKWETITIVTGPNSGGKTRLLQGVAIMQMLAQCGMYAPAKSATLCWATGLFVSLVDEPRSDQKEGRLGTELIRIRDVFERSRPSSLIILDELCSGTNPSEGEEIFRLVISLFGDLRPSVFITTHFLQFAARLKQESKSNTGLRFLQVELDDEECPTFRFNPGVAETSLAHQTAARLGVTREELLRLVHKNCAGD